MKNPSIIQPLQTGRGQMPGPRLLAATAKSRGNSLFSNPEVTPWPRKQFLPPTGSRCRNSDSKNWKYIKFDGWKCFGKKIGTQHHLVTIFYFKYSELGLMAPITRATRPNNFQTLWWQGKFMFGLRQCIAYPGCIMDKSIWQENAMNFLLNGQKIYLKISTSSQKNVASS